MPRAIAGAGDFMRHCEVAALGLGRSRIKSGAGGTTMLATATDAGTLAPDNSRQ
jgi:hypothetical protein